MDENNINDIFDLGSEPVGEDFDPFASDDDNRAGSDTTEAKTMSGNASKSETDTEIGSMTDTDSKTEDKKNSEQPTGGSETKQAKASPPEQTKSASSDIASKKTEDKEPDPVGYADKPPVFEYAGATENIDDASKTFDELRIEKSTDFPELEDGKRVSWTVEYGKITKAVPDPKGTSIGKMKSDIETSKEFEDSLKKRGADKNPTCKIKPRVTAQSKGKSSSYKGVFTNVADAEASGKIISIVPSSNGRVYEIRNTEMGRFITLVDNSELLDHVQAGFIPALPLIPFALLERIISFFRYYMQNGAEKEALVNIYWDKHNKEYTADVPKQETSRTSVESQISEDYPEKRYIHYMDIHSHNRMNAVFSPIDDKDEQATRLYTVIGNLQEYFPDVKTRFSNGGNFLAVDPVEVFELGGRPFPEEWTENVRFKFQGVKSNGKHDDMRHTDGVDEL